MPGEGPAEKSLVEQHGIRSAYARERLDAFEPACGVGLLEAMDGDAVWGWASFLQEVEGNLQHGVQPSSLEGTAPQGLQGLHPHVAIEIPSKPLGNSDALALFRHVRPLRRREAQN